MDEHCLIVYFILQNALSVSLVTNLAANNYNLQCDLTRNGVLWSLLLFMFDYDYTLDESGVATDEKTNNQKLANNLAKMSILACVALCGYQLVEPEKEPPSPPKTESKRSSVDSIQGANLTQSSYMQNAQNLIQNSKHLTQNFNVEKSPKLAAITDGNEKSGPVAESQESKVMEKENVVNKQKYLIRGTASNAITKKVLDVLLTTYISNQFATETENVVSIYIFCRYI